MAKVICFTLCNVQHELALSTPLSKLDLTLQHKYDMFAAAQASFTQKSIQLADDLPADPMLFRAPSEISAPAVRSHALLSN